MNIPALQLPVLGPQDGAKVGEEVNTLLNKLIAALRTPPYYVILRGAPPEEDRGLATYLARSIAQRRPYSPGIPPESRKRVSFTRVHIDSRVAVVGQGVTSYSRTNLPLELHTDTSYSPFPHQLVAFQMIRADAEGGETLLMPVERIIDALDSNVCAHLSRPNFEFGRGLLPILWEYHGTYRIRYYRNQIDSSAKNTMPEEDLEAIGRLDEVLQLDTLQDRFRINPGEILFINNTRVLHGRTGFAATSERLMYRFRAQTGCLD